ncbi:DUF5597 domain-containing protein [Bacteroides sp. GD17]|jgi:hypothetical protein|uniref:DUF5597 domain-containing protein n=1 Tax=Bacteroides sp. GD17 TaxID=3139826 RepID=UPI0025D0CF58|nr:DUF5597 domain-containing protein [uncultured Bacteroides sp.]
MKNNAKWLICQMLVAMMVAGQYVQAQTSTPVPRIIRKGNHHTLEVDGKPFFMLGGQVGNSSNWPSMLPGVWDTMKTMHANTLEIPIYWEEVEPVQGSYDFSSVQRILDQARENKVRLILLWFATWKNGSNHYMPEWMKKDSKQYYNVTSIKGTPVDSPSPHAKATMEADAKAFREFMAYLKEKDPQHTVIMVQVENEPGTWGSIRDYGKEAQKLFAQQVPSEVFTTSVCKELGVDKNAKGSWAQVFGERADEYFHAWHVAKYINYVAQAGKEVNPLPLFVNVALRDPLTNPTADNYESGGATDNVISLWKAAAPCIDMVSPDIYLRGDETVLKVIDLYARDDNALMVPETGSANSKYLYKVIEKGIGFSPFGVDKRRQALGNATRDALSYEYELLDPMNQELARWAAEGRIQTVIEPEDHSEQHISLGEWEAIIIFGGGRGNNSAQSAERAANGKAMIIRLSDNEFLGIGTNCRFTFNTAGKNKGRAWQYLKVKEGKWENGEFKMSRILNGDETDWGGPQVGEIPNLLHFTLVAR